MYEIGRAVRRIMHNQQIDRQLAANGRLSELATVHHRGYG
jgi:hypothetical protein